MRSVDRIICVLDGLAREPEGATLSELARLVQLSIPTTFRILLALAEHAMVEYDRETRRYRLGISLVRLAYHVLDHYSVRSLMRSHLMALRDRWQESFFYSELIDDSVICLEVVLPNRPHVAGFSVRVGRRMPLHSSASAKAILAFIPPDVAEGLLAQQVFTPYTQFTVTSRTEYIRRLEDVRRLGYAVCDQETQLGVVAIAVPVRDQSGRVGASITVLGTVESIKAKMDGLVADLLAVAEQASRLRPATPEKPRGRVGRVA